MIVRKEILTQSFSFFHKLNPTFSFDIIAREIIEGGARKLGLKLFNLKNDNSYAIGMKLCLKYRLICRSTG